MGIDMEKKKQLSCPQCQEIIIKDHGFVAWCDKCNWNVKPEENKEPKTLFEKIYLKAGKRSSEKMLSLMIQNGELLPKVTFQKIITLCFSALVHILSFGLLLSGIYLIIAMYPFILPMLFGLLLVFIAWATRPIGYKLTAKPLSREQFPVTYQIVDEISSLFNTKKVYGIIINGEFNASFAQVGFKRKKIMHLGLPLISILKKQELVSLISHELAHGINGDLNRSIFIGSAMSTLSRWYQMIKPARLYETLEFTAIIALFMIPVNLFLLLVSKLIYMYLYCICQLDWLDSQRAEYMADNHAVMISGKDAKLAMLDKLHLDSLFDFSIQKTINNPNSNPLLDEFQNQVAQIPSKELERIRRLNLMSNSKLDVTHPPTVNRISYINSLKDNPAKYQLTDELYNHFIVEISSLRSNIEKKIINDYKKNVLGW
ncbi:M48 family metallopeptidase [Paenibacillus psychroresistens]|nr:M48 family metallopeptidase [Paenibacillus psychroresistens]